MNDILERNEQVLILMTKLNIKKEEAEELVDLAMNDPDEFAKRAGFIRQMRDAPDARPVKGITLHHIRHKVGRNAKCPCGSGKKFKKCDCFRQERKIGIIVHRVEDKNAASDSTE